MGKISLLDAIKNSTDNTYSGTTSGNQSDVHIFIDDNGNVTQIKKSSKDRLKFYIDPEITFITLPEFCVIGVSDEVNGACSFGIALGVGDEGGLNNINMAFATYE